MHLFNRITLVVVLVYGLSTCGQFQTRSKSYLRIPATPTIHATAKVATIFRPIAQSYNNNQLNIEILMQGYPDHFLVKKITCYPNPADCPITLPAIPYPSPQVIASMTHSPPIAPHDSSFNFEVLYNNTHYLLNLTFITPNQVTTRIKRTNIPSDHNFRYFESFDTSFVFDEKYGFKEQQTPCFKECTRIQEEKL